MLHHSQLPPPSLANALLKELLVEAPSYESITFKLFDNVVKSPHTACFYVDNLEELQRQKSEYYYNGNDLMDVRQILPTMRQVSDIVRDAVNQEVATRIRDHYPDGQKLNYQTPNRGNPMLHLSIATMVVRSTSDIIQINCPISVHEQSSEV